jgi:hypothetical protein
MIRQSNTGEAAISQNQNFEAYDNQHKWYGQEVGANSDPLIDPATGQPFIIREFIFAFNPEALRLIKQKKMAIPSKQDLFNSNWKQIEVMLWGDGLVAIMEKEFPPRIVVGKKKYKIILVCQPRQGVIVADKVRSLNQVLDNKK